ncbi:hypothetical protein EDC04DRAFT_2612767 [Pisolithus marmoratus]|nr:hypothetical protein EDC04DRAFT_2612767 [Pisolithus marmoratus]
MPSYIKARPYSDKENFSANHGVEEPGGRSCQPSEKLQQLVSEQQQQVQCHEIKAQRECKRLQLHQLMEAGSKNDGPKGIAGDDQSGLKDDDDDGDNGTQFTSHVVAMKLSGITKEHLMYSKNKVPKAPPMTIDINREIVSSDNEDIKDPFISPCPSSDHESSQCKKTKERHTGHTTPDVEDTQLVRDKGKFFHIGVNYDTDMSYAQPCFGDTLLDASWAQAHKVTGVNLAHTPQLAKLVHNGFFLYVDILFMDLGSPVTDHNFHSSQSKNAIKKNQALVEGLKEGTNFAFKHMSAEEDGQQGFLKVLLIQKIINTMWFVNKHDDRVVFHDYFKLFPLPALALVLAAVCLSQAGMMNIY